MTLVSDGVSMNARASGWSPRSWREKPIEQSPEFTDEEQLSRTLGQIQTSPPLVSFEAVMKLRKQLVEVQNGHRFLVQGGDCAERFADCTRSTIECKMKLITQLGLLLSWAGGLPTTRIGRIAGQYAKPRTCLTERLADGRVVPSFRGDIINGVHVADRTPDASRLIHAYRHCAETHRYMQSIWEETRMFQELRNREHWNVDFLADDETRGAYEAIADDLTAMLARGDSQGLELERDVPMYVSHEGMLLPYEEALCRVDEASGQYYCSSAHFLWIGDRTRQLDNAHIEFFRGVANPIGIKVGPSADPSEIVALCKRLNPNNEDGKITLITRMGRDAVYSHLVPLIKTVQAANIPITWQCDPMHGNNRSIMINGKEYKVRYFADIVKELSLSFQVHVSLGSKQMGVHLEITGENVTECLGGGDNFPPENLPMNYHTACDPRLNRMQALEMAFRAARKITKVRERSLLHSGEEKNEVDCGRTWRHFVGYEQKRKYKTLLKRTSNDKEKQMVHCGRTLSRELRAETKRHY